MKIKPTSKTGGVLVEIGPQESFPSPSLFSPDPLPAFGLKQILVPVDFSDCSKKALQYAIPFARQFGAELKLLHVIEPYPAVPEMAPYDLDNIKDGKAQLEAFRQALGDDVRTSASVRTGMPHVEIAEAAKELGIDLIILSTHGRKGLSRMVLGSTAEKVVRHAPCPVLIVRESEHEFVPVDSMPPRQNDQPQSYQEGTTYMQTTNSLDTLMMEHPFLSGINPELCDLFSDCAARRLFASQQEIFHEGNEASHFYLILTGSVALETFVPGCGMVTIETLGPGDALGWSWLFPPYKWHFTASTRAPTEVISFDAAALRAIADENRDFRDELLTRVAKTLLQRAPGYEDAID